MPSGLIQPGQATSFLLVPKLLLGNAELEYPASSWELEGKGSQAGAWEPV